MRSHTQTVSITQAVTALKGGGVIAYPTEAVFGLGCDPDNEQAIQQLLDLKQRPASKGLIIIASEVQQLEAYVKPLPAEQWQKALNTWPGPVTWLMPARESVSPLLTGEHSGACTIAVRVTGHPVARALCERFAKPIISTSANITNSPPALSVDEVAGQFNSQLAGIVDGEVNKQARPSAIRDLLSDKVIRGS